MVSKNSKLRMLARKGAAIGWHHINPELFAQIQLADSRLAEKLAELRRFVDRNVDTANGLTYDEIGEFDLQDLRMHRREDVADLIINDSAYFADFEIRCTDDDGCEIGSFRMWPVASDGTPGETEVTDELLREFAEAKIFEYVQDHEGEYSQREAEGREAARAQSQLDSIRGK